MYLEHVNITVPDPKTTAATLCDIFGWDIRWQGEAKDNGFTVHVGDDDSYLAYMHRTSHWNQWAISIAE